MSFGKYFEAPIETPVLKVGYAFGLPIAMKSDCKAGKFLKLAQSKAQGRDSIELQIVTIQQFSNAVMFRDPAKYTPEQRRATTYASVFYVNGDGFVGNMLLKGESYQNLKNALEQIDVLSSGTKNVFDFILVAEMKERKSPKSEYFAVEFIAKPITPEHKERNQRFIAESKKQNNILFCFRNSVEYLLNLMTYEDMDKRGGVNAAVVSLLVHTGAIEKSAASDVFAKLNDSVEKFQHLQLNESNE